MQQATSLCSPARLTSRNSTTRAAKASQSSRSCPEHLPVALVASLVLVTSSPCLASAPAYAHSKVNNFTTWQRLGYGLAWLERAIG
jgi:hypothetical protein